MTAHAQSGHAEHRQGAVRHVLRRDNRHRIGQRLGLAGWPISASEAPFLTYFSPTADSKQAQVEPDRTLVGLHSR